MSSKIESTVRKTHLKESIDTNNANMYHLHKDYSFSIY